MNVFKVNQNTVQKQVEDSSVQNEELMKNQKAIMERMEALEKENKTIRRRLANVNEDNKGKSIL